MLNGVNEHVVAALRPYANIWEGQDIALLPIQMVQTPEIKFWAVKNIIATDFVTGPPINLVFNTVAFSVSQGLYEMKKVREHIFSGRL